MGEWPNKVPSLFCKDPRIINYLGDCPDLHWEVCSWSQATCKMNAAGEPVCRPHVGAGVWIGGKTETLHDRIRGKKALLEASIWAQFMSWATEFLSLASPDRV